MVDNTAPAEPVKAASPAPKMNVWERLYQKTPENVAWDNKRNRQSSRKNQFNRFNSNNVKNLLNQTDKVRFSSP